MLKNHEMKEMPMKSGNDMASMAKKNVLENLKALAEKAMGSKLGGLKKVEVSSDSPEGLQEGLEVAQDVTEELPEDDMHTMPDGSMMKDEEMMDDKMVRMYKNGEEPMTPEEIDEKIMELLKLKESMK